MILLTMHHMIADGLSLKVLVRELAVLYQAFDAGCPAPLPDLPSSTWTTWPGSATDWKKYPLIPN